jgi:hypothetical protein
MCAMFRKHYPFPPPPPGIEVAWRAEVRRYSVVVDADAEHYAVSDPQLELRWYVVSHHTPKGFWAGGRFILNTATKRWANLSEEEAIKSCIARITKHKSILESRVQRLSADLACATAALDTAQQ